MSNRHIYIAVSSFIALASVALAAEDVPVELPDGFSIEKVAGNDLVPDASAMTVDPDGNPIVSGPGYVRRLFDTNEDGIFDQFETLASPKGIAQGIWFDGAEIWLTVDGAIKRSVSRDSGQPFGFEDVVPITTDQEHGSHAIRKGTDGWWYVLCGNATTIRPEYHSLPTSPIKQPRAGFLMRFPADVGTGQNFAAEIVCHGFRNAYDFDFDPEGRIYVYDSDGERDASLPWYRPTRVFRMKPGDDAGWVSASWKRPASFFDMPQLVGDFGRGSPTGVAVCDAKEFGSEFDQAVFVGDWTFGRIGVVKRGGEVEIFAKPKGNFGFAITDFEFTTKGDLLVTTGGRGTEGALYRIWRTKDLPPPKGDLERAAREMEIEKSFDAFNQKMGANSRRNVSGAIKPFSWQMFDDELTAALSCDDRLVGIKVRSLQLMMNGCNGDRMFAGHQPERPIRCSVEKSQSIATRLLTLLNRDIETFEVARLIGMLELNDSVLANAVVQIAAKEKDPVKRIHYLNCIAVAGGKLDSESIDHVAECLLSIRRQIDAAELPVDRNWAPRMRQLAEELFRNMSIPEAIVKDVSFGQPSDMWIYDSLPEIFRGVARAKIAAKVTKDPSNVTRQQLQSLSVDPRHIELIRSFANEDEFTDVVVMAVSSSSEERDRDVLLRGLKSFNLTVAKASLIGLRKIEGKTKSPADFEALLNLESQLGWTNPEISVRDQMVQLLQKWTRVSFGYQLRQYDLQPEQIRMQRTAIEAWKVHLVSNHAVKLNVAASVSEVLDRYSRIDFSIGDLSRGKLAYKKFQCASCHDGGGQNSGPSLAGIASRFSRDDVLRAIVDPNDNVPDRYRAVVVATEDGQLFRGSIVYESMAGIMMATSTGEVVRIDADDIESRRKSTMSLMPEGLLNEATDQDVADLWVYLQQLQ